jgi:hypothetical protein
LDDEDMGEDDEERGVAGDIKRFKQIVKTHNSYIKDVGNQQLLSPDEIQRERVKLDAVMNNIVDRLRPHAFNRFLETASYKDLKSLRDQADALTRNRNKVNNERWLSRTLYGEVMRKLEETKTTTEKLRVMITSAVSAGYTDKYGTAFINQSFRDDLNAAISNAEKAEATAEATAAASAASAAPRAGWLGL